MNEPMVVFPPGVVDGNGRRVRLGSRVRFELDGVERLGEVIAWAGPSRGLEIDLPEFPYEVAVPPVRVVRVDEPNDDPVTVGWRVVDPDPTPTLLLVPIGTRDVQPRRSGDLGPFSTEHAPMAAARGDTQFREWSRKTAEILSVGVEEPAAKAVTYLDMPMLRRALDEASLPDRVARLVFIVTDQDPPGTGDTVHVPTIARHWLVGRGHLDPPETALERPVLDIGTPIVVRRAPHVLDAVFHQIAEPLQRVSRGCGRISVVIAGGTPAMTYAAVLAASGILGQSAVRTVQVPAPLRVGAALVEQPLIELDLADTMLGLRDDSR
jgi:hypothetical protein